MTSLVLKHLKTSQDVVKRFGMSEVIYRDHMSLPDRSARVNHAAARPLWQQVADDLRAEITAGHLTPGARLPSEIELAEQYAVSRVTIRHSIKALAEESLLEAVHGRGTFVASS
jgi:DNA-binding GntR family transcriptional regulator